MRGRHYNHSGTGKENFGNIEPYSTVEISGMGNVTMGNIGHDTTVVISGMGSVSITGTVEKGVRITQSGMGTLTFKERPSEEVMALINKSGMGKINMPGGYAGSNNNDNSNTTAYLGSVMVAGKNIVSSGSRMITGGMSMTTVNGVKTRKITDITLLERDGKKIVNNKNGTVTVTAGGVITTYKGNKLDMNNDQLLLDGRPITEDDKRIERVDVESPRAAAVASAPHVSLKQQKHVWDEPRSQRVAQPPRPAKQGDELSTEVKSYAKSVVSVKLNTERFNSLNISEEAKDKYEGKNPNNFDPVSTEIINIPVTAVSGKVYDISTLLNQPVKDDGTREEPESLRSFHLSDIRPAPFVDEAIKKDLKKLEKKAAKRVSVAEQGTFSNTSRSPSPDNAPDLTMKEHKGMKNE